MEYRCRAGMWRKVNYSNSNIHQAVYASEDTYYVINLTDGSKTFTYKTEDGLLSLRGEDIYVYNDTLNAEENFWKPMTQRAIKSLAVHLRRMKV